MNKSIKRNKILDVFKKSDLLTAHDVCEKLPDIDKVTIYRNLAVFVEQNILREVNIIKGVASYEINKENDHHQHLLCENCHKIIAVDINQKALQKLLPKDVDIEKIELNLTGKCKDCK